MSLVITGISELVTNDVGTSSTEGAGGGPANSYVAIAQAALVVGDDGLVLWSGPSSALPGQAGDQRVDLGGRAVLPGFVDSHTHLVFAGHRAGEWESRMAGVAYAAGGIRNTVTATRAASDASLLANASGLVAEALRSGTTTIEVKSGYGLTVVDERRCVDVAATVTTEVTFLGAHVVAPEYQGAPDDYVGLVCGEMLDACAPVARFVDAFCDRGAFDADQTRAVLDAGVASGLIPRVHANQLGPGPGVQLGVSMEVASCDHCSHLDTSDIDALADGAGLTVATLLPAAEFSTRSAYPPARRLVDAGATVALASDCNPGSSYTTSMPFVVALAVREMHMTVPEVIWSATAGGARALRRRDIGWLGPGSRADLVVLDAPSVNFLAYRPGVDLVSAVLKRGKLVAGAWPSNS